MHTTELTTKFIQALNDVHSYLAFTVELEEEGSIVFYGTIIRAYENS